MKKPVLIIGLFILVFLFGISNVWADTIDFDDLSTPSVSLIRNYADFEWYGSTYVLNPEGYTHQGYDSVYDANLVSEKNLGAFGSGGFKSDSSFDLNSIYLAAAWNDGLEVSFEGKSGGSWVASLTVTLYADPNKWADPTTPYRSDFDGFNNIDELSWTVNAQYSTPFWGPDYDFFSMDEITFNEPASTPTPGPVPTPEPSTVLLMGVGLIGLVGIRKKVAKR